MFLDVLINSIISQTYRDWELLLIDDGSTDSSGEICDSYALKDSRIKVWHQSNGGVCSARNKGLSMASGEFIYFSDDDDELLPDGLSSLIDYMKPWVDLVTASYIRYEKNEIVPEYIFKEGFDISADQYFDVISVLPNARFCGRYLWTKLFRKSIITGNLIHFDTDLQYREDVLFLYRYVSHCAGNVVGVNKPVYIYRRRISGQAETSISSMNQRTLDVFYSTERCLGILKNTVRGSQAEKNVKITLVNDYYRIVRHVIKSGGQFRIIRNLNKKLSAELAFSEFFTIRLKELFRMISFKVKRIIRHK